LVNCQQLSPKAIRKILGTQSTNTSNAVNDGRTENNIHDSNKPSNNASDDKLCVICLDKPKTHAINVCGHKCLCGPCITKMPQNATCPICRVAFNSKNVIRIYE
jgi:hypothetical protein